MRQSFFTIILCFLITLSLAAQNNGNRNGSRGDMASVKVSGTVLAEDGQQPLAYATISLFSQRDSSLVSGAITDEKGAFEMDARPGNFYAVIEFLSFQKKTIPEISIERGKSVYDFGVISMVEDATTLSQVEVTADKSQMQLQLDKRVFNVAKDLSNAGRNASEILDNLPSVQVDIDGNVSLRGSENVRILIDGKPSGLVGIGSTDALRRLQGDLIERIEVITNPSARYDAEGEVGIINIVFKKGKKQGVNGSIGLTAGYPDNYGASYSINFRQEKINFFSNFGIDYRKNPGKGFFYQEFYGEDTLITRTTRNHSRGGLGANIQVGSDWYINKYSTVTGSVLYKHSRGDNNSMLTYRDFDTRGNLLNTTIRSDNEEEPEHNIETSFNFTRTFDEKDRKFTFDFQYQLNDETELSDYYEYSLENPATTTQSSSNTEDEENWLFQADYIHPFGENGDGRFEAGLKTTLRTINNEFTVEQLFDNGEWQVLPQFDDHLLYEENIYAAYVIVGNKLNKLSYQFGLRSEYSDIGTALLDSTYSNNRNYNNLFPSAHFSYEFSKEKQLQLSYSRRLSRPRFRHLLPFSGLSDNRRIWRGNPDLDPEYTNSMELGFLQYFNKGSLLSSIYYRYRTGVIERVSFPNPDGTIAIFPVNLSHENAVGLEFSFSYDFAKWWKANANFDFYRSVVEGEYDGLDLSNDAYTWNTRLNNKFTLFKDVDFQLSGNYRAPRQTSQGKNKAMYSIDAGMSKDILKNKATLTFSARDLFNTRRWSGTTITDDFYSENEFQWRSRQFVLNFSYRINQKKSRREGGRGDFEGGDEGFKP